MNARATITACALLGTSANLLALGIRIPDRDAFATSRGNAFAATADNASAIYYNPAGLTQLLQPEVRVGFYGLVPSEDFTSEAGNFENNRSIIVVPDLYCAVPVEDTPLAVGLGVYAPFGLKQEWPDDAPFRTVGREAELTYLTANLVAAYKFDQKFSVGVGATFNYARLTLIRGVAVPGDQFRFRGEDFALGFNAGALWRPHPQHSFGVTYRSGVAMSFEGDTRFDVPFTLPFPPRQTATANFDFPQNVTIGYSFRPTPKWNLEFNLDWTDWDHVNTFVIEQIPNLELPLHWHSSFFYEFGITRYFAHGFSLSAGYIYSENSVPESFYTPLVPDSNMHFVSIGIGQTLGRLRWDLGYQFVWGPERVIDNPAFSPNAPANGRYEVRSHALTAAIGWKF